MSQLFSPFGGYRKTFSFGYTCLVQLRTVHFCEHFLTLKNDPQGKHAAQMLGATSSARQNIVEGSTRAATSHETEIKLYNVAMGSFQKLADDYEQLLMHRNYPLWSDNDE